MSYMIRFAHAYLKLNSHVEFCITFQKYYADLLALVLENTRDSYLAIDTFYEVDYETVNQNCLVKLTASRQSTEQNTDIQG